MLKRSLYLYPRVESTIFQLQYISVYMCDGRPKKKPDLRSDSQRQRHFVGFCGLTCSSKHLFRETSLFQSPLTTRIGIRRTYSRLKPPGSPRPFVASKRFIIGVKRALLQGRYNCSMDQSIITQHNSTLRNIA